MLDSGDMAARRPLPVVPLVPVLFDLPTEEKEVFICRFKFRLKFEALEMGVVLLVVQVKGVSHTSEI